MEMESLLNCKVQKNLWGDRGCAAVHFVSSPSLPWSELEAAKYLAASLCIGTTAKKTPSTLSQWYYK